MNMFKKFVVATVFLCAIAVVNAQESTKIGIRFGYSMQSVDYDMGMLGLRAGVGADIPAGPVFISPEVDFLYRNNWSTTLAINGKAFDYTQPEFAVSIPIMVKFQFGLGIGAQVDIPIDAKECLDDECSSMDGKETLFSAKRANYDVGIVLSFGHIITPSLALDIRYVYGVTPHYTYEKSGIIGKIKSNPMSSYGFGITYFFL